MRRRAALFLLVAALTAALGLFGRSVSYEQSITSLFNPGDPDILAYKAAGDRFGSDNFVFVAFDDPDLFTVAGMSRVRELAARVGPNGIAGVKSAQSIDAMPRIWLVDDGIKALLTLPKFFRDRAVSALKGQVANLAEGGDALSIMGAVKAAADDPGALDELKRRVSTHPLFRGTVVNARGESTAIVVQLRPTTEFDLKETVRELRQRADAFAAEAGLKSIAVVGPPVLLADGFAAIERDGRRLALLGMFLIALVMLTAVPSLWWTALPIMVGWCVWWSADTLMALAGWRLSLSGGPLMAQVIVLTIPAASHLAIQYRNARRRLDSPRLAASHAFALVIVPIFWCAVSTGLGYGVLLTSALVPVRQFGAILASCTLVAAFLVVILAPFAMMPPAPLEIPVKARSRSRLTVALNGLTRAICRRAGLFLALFLAAALPIMAGMFRVRYEYNYINSFQPNARVVRDYAFVESRLGGIGLYQLIVPVPDGLRMAEIDKFRELDDRLREMTRDGRRAITQSVSLATALDPEGVLGALPEATREEALALKLELIEASPQAELLRSFWNREAGLARVMTRLVESQEAERKEWTFARSLEAAREAFGPESSLTGMSFLLTRTVRSVTSTQNVTVLCTGFGVLAMLALALRSVPLALLGAIPTATSVGLTLGLMGWLGIKIDIATALVASVAFGLAVDQTFHCLIQYRRKRLRHGFLPGVLGGFRITGPGILISSAAISAGFFALWFSEFVPFSNFGLLIAIATAGSLVGNLVLLPTILVSIRGLSARLGGRGVSNPLSGGGRNGTAGPGAVEGRGDATPESEPPAAAKPIEVGSGG